MRTARGLALCAGVAVLGACGGSSSNNGGGGGSCSPGSTAAVTIAAAGVSPAATCVLPGGTVTFTNNDTVQHDIESGTTCTQLNLGAIPPGQSRSATLPTAEVCTYHDAAAPSNMAFQGTIAVTTAPASGPGY